MIALFQRNLITKKGLFSQIPKHFQGQVNFSQDYYKILQVSETATAEDIKKQYYKLVKKYHPDLNKGNEEYFKKINEAYEVIGNETKRKEYHVFKSNPSGYRHSQNQYSGNRSSGFSEYETYQHTHYQDSSQQQRKGKFDEAFKNSQFYQDIKNDESSYGYSDYVQRTEEENAALKKKKIIVFSAVIIGFYLFFDVFIFKTMTSGPIYEINDRQTGQTFLADAQTLEQIRRRGYDTSFISPTVRQNVLNQY